MDEPVVIDNITHQQLSSDAGLLKSVYGLLVSAHYRTRPSDLRQLMENENQRLLIARQQQQVVAVLQLNLEGGFSPELCEQVFMGRRRPQGHLFAQMITAQAGLRRFASFRGLRVQRITVHPNLRRKGIGRLLIDSARQQFREENLDYLASSFALDADTAGFWKKLGFKLVHIGSGRGKSTGQQTVAMIESESARLQEPMRYLQQRVLDNLPVWLLTYCNTMPWQDVRALLGLNSRPTALSAGEIDEISAFADGYRGFELSQAALQKLLINCLQQELPLKPVQQRLLIEKILLNRDWQAVAVEIGGNGRKQLTQEIRNGIKACYEYVRTKS